MRELLNSLFTVTPDTPERARKACLILGFGMFYGLMTGMGIGMVLYHLQVAAAKSYFLGSMAIAGLVASAGVARLIWTADPPEFRSLLWRFATGMGGAAVAPAISVLFMGYYVRYAFLVGAIAGLILTVGLLRTLPER